MQNSERCLQCNAPRAAETSFGPYYDSTSTTAVCRLFKIRCPVTLLRCCLAASYVCVPVIFYLLPEQTSSVGKAEPSRDRTENTYSYSYMYRGGEWTTLVTTGRSRANKTSDSSSYQKTNIKYLLRLVHVFYVTCTRVRVHTYYQPPP